MFAILFLIAVIEPCAKVLLELVKNRLSVTLRVLYEGVDLVIFANVF